jgi:hypothetical protein
MLDIIPMTVIKELNDKQLVHGISFEVEALFMHVLDTFGLSKKAANGTIEIGITIDCAKFEGKLCNHWCQGR